MATTTPNFGWSVPTSTDLVKDGATAIETLGDSIDASLVDLKGGTTGQVLAKASGTDMDFTWVAQDDSNAIQNAIVDAKGDLIAASAADTPARLAVGANNTVLTADSTQSTGMKWASPSGPAFSAYLNGDQALTDGVATKIAYNAEDFDTDGCYDPTTNYRFTPTKAGYYQISVTTFGSSVTNTRTFSRLYKNGSNYVTMFDTIPTAGEVNAQFSGAALVYMNGTTDYLEVYIRMTGTTLKAVGSNSTENKFAGVWIRS